MPSSAAQVARDEPDWQRLRGRFPVLERKTYLNSCSYGALSDAVAASFQQYVEDRAHKGTDWQHWVERSDAVRRSVARLVGALPAEIAVTTSASAGINALASALDFRAGRNKVVISDFEFPTNAQIWYAQERRGARVERVEAQGNYIPVEAFERCIDGDTQLVAVTQVCYRNGAMLDIPAITETAHRHGALIMVDGYQVFGTRAVDLTESGVDFAVGGMVKYLLGTAGIGFLYVRQVHIAELIPTVTGWFGQADIFAMDHTRFDPAPDARRFESGTPPIPNCYAAEAGLALIEAAGLAPIQARIANLTDAIKGGARSHGYRLATPDDPARHGALIALRSRDEHALVAALDGEGVVTSCRDGNLRISPHFYNDQADIDALFDALRKHQHLLFC